MKNEHIDKRNTKNIEKNNFDDAVHKSKFESTRENDKIDERKDPKKSAKRPSLLLISVGSILTSMVAAGFLLGYGLDALIDTRPIFLLSFGVLGFIGGILRVYKILSNPELY